MDGASGCYVLAQAHPPVRMEHWKGQVVDDPVGMIAAVGVKIDPDAETGQAEVKICADGALDAHAVADVTLAVVAVEHGPAQRQLGGQSKCNLSCISCLAEISAASGCV